MTPPGSLPEEPTTNWLQNDALARKLIAEGHRWERIVAERLQLLGLDVEVQRQQVRQDVSEAVRGDYTGSCDLLVNGWRTQVKSRNLGKWYDPVYLCSARSWKHEGDTTDLWICVLQRTGEMRCVSGERAREHSVEMQIRDRVRKISRLTVRAVPLKHWSKLGKVALYLRFGPKEPPR